MGVLMKTFLEINSEDDNSSTKCGVLKYFAGEVMIGYIKKRNMCAGCGEKIKDYF